MQIRINTTAVFDVMGIKALLPTGYWSSERSYTEPGVRTFDVMQDGALETVGTIESGNGQLVFKFKTETQSEKGYVAAFSLANPEFSPMKVLWGIVYTIQPGKYQLNKKPWSLLSEALAESMLVGQADAYLVWFYQGNWTSDSLKVESMQKILPTGQLLQTSDPQTLILGGLENEKTM